MLSLVVTGFPKHAPYLAKLLRERAGAHAVYYSDARTNVLRAAAHALHADGYITLGGPNPKEVVRNICAARKRPVILLWCGSDVETVARAPEQLERLRLQNVIHWASAAHLVDALSRLGIAARYVPVGPPSEHDPDAVCRGIMAAFRDAADLTSSSAGDSGKLRLAISGQQTFSIRVADNSQSASASISATLLGTRSTSETAVSVLNLLASDAWYTIGEPSGPLAFEFACSMSRKRRIVHWLGDDVEALRENGALLRRLRAPRFVHLAQNDEVRVRLWALGLRAQVVPLAAVSAVDAVPPLPQTFALMLYVPREGSQFYGRYQYERLMQALAPERVHYFIVGGGHIEVPDGAIAERIEWSHDLSRIYERSTALVRFTPPDYTSSMVIEALLYGRHVLSASEFPFVTRVRTFADMENEVRSLLRRDRAGTLAPAVDAARAMQAQYSPDRCLSLLAQACGWTSAATPRTAVVPHA